jgi:sRNA-binding protein
MMVAVNHLASLAHPKKRIEDWLDIWCPWLTRAESTTIITKAIIHQEHWTADQLAWRLRLTDADRTTLAITTIGAIDCSKAERRKRRAIKAKERMARNRMARSQHKVTIGANADNENCKSQEPKQTPS